MTVFDKELQEFRQISRTEFSENRDKFRGPCTGKMNVIDLFTHKRLQIDSNVYDRNVHLKLGDTRQYFKCINNLTQKEKNISIVEWELVSEQFTIIDIMQYNKAQQFLKNEYELRKKI